MWADLRPARKRKPRERHEPYGLLVERELLPVGPLPARPDRLTVERIPSDLRLPERLPLRPDFEKPRKGPARRRRPDSPRYRFYRRSRHPLVQWGIDYFLVLWNTFATRPLFWGLRVASDVTQFFLSPRLLGLSFLGVVAIFTLTGSIHTEIIARISGWMTAPLSLHVVGSQIPLFSLTPTYASPADIVYGPRKVVIASVGMLIAGVLALAMLMTLIRPRWFTRACGLLLCALTISMFVVVFNHPDLIDQFDRQDAMRPALIRVLGDTCNPPIDISAYATPLNSLVSTDPGDWYRGLTYLCQDRAFLWWYVMLGLLFGLKGPLRRRLVVGAAWAALALGLGFLFASPRLLAEHDWAKAVMADRNGDETAARHLASAALNRCPGFTWLPRTWKLLGQIDYRTGKDTPEYHLFMADQWTQNHQPMKAMDELKQVEGQNFHTPQVQRFLADAHANLAMSMFEQKKWEAAQDHWTRALEIDPSEVYRKLFVAPVWATRERNDPDAIEKYIHALVENMADRSFRGQFEAMLGDCYFQAGQYGKARDFYNKSLDSFSLPKQVNYRAQRGTLGM